MKAHNNKVIDVYKKSIDYINSEFNKLELDKYTQEEIDNLTSTKNIEINRVSNLIKCLQ